jgi:hypothetical protein
MRVHLEGFGLQGALTRAFLATYYPDAVVTWHDIEAPINAWTASTGAIYPGGDPATKEGYESWVTHLDVLQRASPVCTIAERCFSRADMWYSQKSPPHQGRYTPAREMNVGGEAQLKCAPDQSMHLNAQLFVPQMRHLYAAERTDSVVMDTIDGKPLDVDFYVVCHGFGARLDHYFWGWTRLVELDYDPFFSRNSKDRPSFYFRKGQLFFYAYPCPGSKWWYAGSSLIRCPLGRTQGYDPVPKYDTWLRHFLGVARDSIKITSSGSFLTGWRPAQHDEVAEADRWVTRDAPIIGGAPTARLTVPPLWHSGIRHFPRVWDQLSAAFKELTP